MVIASGHSRRRSPPICGAFALSMSPTKQLRNPTISTGKIFAMTRRPRKAPTTSSGCASHSIFSKAADALSGRVSPFKSILASSCARRNALFMARTRSSSAPWCGAVRGLALAATVSCLLSFGRCLGWECVSTAPCTTGLVDSVDSVDFRFFVFELPRPMAPFFSFGSLRFVSRPLSLTRAGRKKAAEKMLWASRKKMHFSLIVS